MSERTFDDVGDVLDQILGQSAAAICVLKIGRVERYDSATQRADVQPLYKRIIEDDLGERAEAEPVLPSVPVVFSGCGGLAIALPLQKGDTVLLLFADHSLDRMDGDRMIDPLATKDPGSTRTHHASDAVAFPVAGSGLKAGASAIEIKRTGAVHVGGDQPLVTRSEFLSHTHATAGTGAPSPPIVGAAPGSAATFPGTAKLRG